MEDENLMKYGWRSFLKTPFSLLFFVFLLLLCYIIYEDRKRLIEENNELQSDLERCIQDRLKDKETYIDLIDELGNNKQNKSIEQ